MCPRSRIRAGFYLRVLRGGAYDSQAKSVRSTARFRYDSDVRYPANGFRLVRELH